MFRMELDRRHRSLNPCCRIFDKDLCLIMLLQFKMMTWRLQYALNGVGRMMHSQVLTVHWLCCFALYSLINRKRLIQDDQNQLMWIYDLAVFVVYALLDLPASLFTGSSALNITMLRDSWQENTINLLSLKFEYEHGILLALVQFQEGNQSGNVSIALIKVNITTMGADIIFKAHGVFGARAGAYDQHKKREPIM